MGIMGFSFMYIFITLHTITQPDESSSQMVCHQFFSLYMYVIVLYMLKFNHNRAPRTGLQLGNKSGRIYLDCSMQFIRLQFIYNASKQFSKSWHDREYTKLRKLINGHQMQPQKLDDRLMMRQAHTLHGSQSGSLDLHKG